MSKIVKLLSMSLFVKYLNSYYKRVHLKAVPLKVHMSYIDTIALLFLNWECITMCHIHILLKCFQIFFIVSSLFLFILS